MWPLPAKGQLPSAHELLLAYDAVRPRTQQAEIGMSALGTCQRRTGYRVHGVPPDEDYQPGGVQNVMGTAIHEAFAQGARLALPQAQAEDLEVRFGGLTGHPDLYCEGVVRDLKTLGYTMQVEDRRRNGPKRNERWQVHTYGAGLILRGLPVHTVQLDYLARDSGDEYLFEEAFDLAVVAEAMEWLETVRTTEIALLSRDYRPDSAVCQSCEFFRRCWDAERGTDDRHVLFIDDPDALKWIELLTGAGLDKKFAQQQVDDAKGALDHLRTVTRPGEKEFIAVPGLEEGLVLRFSVSKGRASPDMEQISEDYRRAGAEPPMRQGDPVIKVALVARRGDE